MGERRYHGTRKVRADPRDFMVSGRNLAWTRTSAPAQGHEIVVDRPIGVDRHVCVVIEVTAGIQPEVGLQENQSSAGPQYPSSFVEQGRGRGPVQMLEKVGGEHDVEGLSLESAQIAGVAHFGLHMRRSGFEDGVVNVHRHHATRADVVGEVAPACAQLEDVVCRSNPPLQVAT